MTNYKIGDRAVFVEHVVICRDKDSLTEEPIKIIVHQDAEYPEVIAVNTAAKRCVSAMSGNSIEYEYVGKTGYTSEAEYAIITTGWKRMRELTPDDGSIKFDELFKLF